MSNIRKENKMPRINYWANTTYKPTKNYEGIIIEKGKLYYPLRKTNNNKITIAVPSKTLPKTDVSIPVTVPVRLEKNDNVRKISAIDEVWRINEVVKHIYNCTGDLLTLLMFSSVNKRFEGLFSELFREKEYFNVVFFLNEGILGKIFQLIRYKQPNFALNMLLKIKELYFSPMLWDTPSCREQRNAVLAFFADNPTSKLSKLRMGNFYNDMILGILPQVKELEIGLVNTVDAMDLAGFQNLEKLKIDELFASKLKVSVLKKLEMMNIGTIRRRSVLTMFILPKLKEVKIINIDKSLVMISEKILPQLKTNYGNREDFTIIETARSGLIWSEAFSL